MAIRADKEGGKPDDANNRLAREPTVVCWLMPAGNGEAELGRLLEHIPAVDQLAVGVSESYDGLGSAHVRRGTAVQAIGLPAAATLAHLANQAGERWPSRDLVLVFPGVTLIRSWLDRLHAAVATESTAATASALGQSAVELTTDPAASSFGTPGAVQASPGSTGNNSAAVAAASAQLRPRLAAPLPTCVYLRRPTLDLVGPLDETLCSNRAALLDLGLRARRRGLANLLADDLLVLAPEAELPEDDLRALQARHGALLDSTSQPPGPALHRSLALTSVALEPLRVTFDARALGPHVGGTQVYLLELLEALAAGRKVQLRVLVGPDVAGRTRARLRDLSGTELLSYAQALERPEPSHVVHRPQQVFSGDDLALLRPLGERFVITHHDLIAYHNPTYFASNDLWQRYVRTTRHALAVADQVIFFSRHAMCDAAREDLVDPARCIVIYPGADSHLGSDPSANEEPEPGSTLAEAVPQFRAARLLESTPFLLCLGADYQHKNRPFALALMDQLRRTHDWQGAIVLAGPHMDDGSSQREEQEVRVRCSIPPELVIELSAVSDGERSWLMSRAAAIVYPTVHEGFGLVPFEAAAFGVPCLFAAQSSLRELFDTELAALVPWDPVRSAARAAPLLTFSPERRRHVENLRQAAAALRWADCAQATVDAYGKALAAPYRQSTEGAWQALEREDEIVRLDRDVHNLAASVHELEARVVALTDDLGPDALALVGPHALLSRADQHALLAVAARPTLRRLVLGGLRRGYRAMRAVRSFADKTSDLTSSTVDGRR